MRALYNLHWNPPYNQPVSISRYTLTVTQNGSVVFGSDVYGNNAEVWLEENSNIHAEVCTVDSNGQVSSPATTDFSVPDYLDPCNDTPCGDVAPPVPEPPTSFGADFQRWEV